MNHADDVDRLLVWLKAPMVHYRDFAPRLEVAEAVAAWPVLHQAAVQTGIVSEAEPSPRGKSAAGKRAARDRVRMPAGSAPATSQSPPPRVAEPPRDAAGPGSRVRAIPRRGGFLGRLQ